MGSAGRGESWGGGSVTVLDTGLPDMLLEATQAPPGQLFLGWANLFTSKHALS